MTQANPRGQSDGWQILFAILLVAAVYWPGLHGSWLFDDYPNIVDNKGIQPSSIGIATLYNAALSSPASELKRPLASLTFAANFLLSGLDPFWMKLTNLFIHLGNGCLVFTFVRRLLRLTYRRQAVWSRSPNPVTTAYECFQWTDHDANSWISLNSRLALSIAIAWMLLPINVTGVLYVVQRMESLANLFVLAGLIGYVDARSLMQKEAGDRVFTRGFLRCIASIVTPAVIGLGAKETAALLPLYAALTEWLIFQFRNPIGRNSRARSAIDWRLIVMYIAVLALPFAIGLSYLLPQLLKPVTWSTRDFTMGTRLLTEARVVVDYIAWTLFPTAHELSFYHDDYVVSGGWTQPRSTLPSIAILATLIGLAYALRHRRPLAALGIAFYLGGHSLTGTVLPLELVYEHRNYFPSFGLLLALASLFGFDASGHKSDTNSSPKIRAGLITRSSLILASPLLLWWTCLTVMTTYAWGDPLRLAKELANRDPESPRAQYELGRTYVIYSNYRPGSPYTPLALASLTRAAALPNSSILPEQALIFMSARMHSIIQESWWTSMVTKLGARKPQVQDESALIALMHCMREGQCDVPKDRLAAAFKAGMSHEMPSARLTAAYGEYSWSLLGDRAQGEHLMSKAISIAPSEAAYRITLIRMLLAMNRKADAIRQLGLLKQLNTAGRLQEAIDQLQQLIDAH